jgi:hypothetical protein
MNVVTSKEHLAPISKLPVVVVSVTTIVGFRARNNSRTFKGNSLRKSR